MNQAYYVREGGGVLAVLLGLGSLDLTVLNAFVFPALLTVTATDISASQTAPRLPNAPITQSVSKAAQAVAVPVTVAPASALARPVEPPASNKPKPSAADGYRANIVFGSTDWRIGPEGQLALTASLRVLTSSHAPIEVIGHADSPGTRKYNQQLSELRAQTVTELLIRYGVDPARILVRAVGEDEPSPDGNDRRVEILTGSGL